MTYRFKFIAFDRPDVYDRAHSTLIVVAAEDEAEALKKAHALLERQYYELVEIIEES